MSADRDAASTPPRPPTTPEDACWYLDSSALVKLVVEEPETRALRESLTTPAHLVTSDLATTEVLRAVHVQGPLAMTRAMAVLGCCERILVDTEVLETAGRLATDDLRSLDAIHLASAALLGDHLDAFVTYDRRQALAAQAEGFGLLTPGIDGIDHIEGVKPPSRRRAKWT